MKRLCLVNGKHTPGSQWEKECPLNPDSAGKRDHAARRRTREIDGKTPAQTGPATTLQGAQEGPSESDDSTPTSEAGFGVLRTAPTLAGARVRLSGGRPRGGRPPAPLEQASARTRSRRRRAALAGVRRTGGTPEALARARAARVSDG